MGKEMDKRVALVLGGSGGIGRSVVEKLAEEGYAIGIHYSSSKTNAKQLEASIVARGGQAISVGGDVANEIEMSMAFELVEKAFGSIDVVINTAGIMLLSPIAELDLNDLDRMHRTNIRGALVVSQLAAQRVSKGGAIINFSTSVTRSQFPNYGAYVASKAAIESISMILARELRGKDITVNTVAPGPTATPLFLNGKDEHQIQHLANAVPLERLGEPNDISEVVAFLAGPARWINGQIIFVNGGLA
ncbi:SDR family oxidoreductase [Lysinibacillus fusiformis]|uniref:3-ketoacyl-ACP reductase n=1 Tax=Lysinibacillus fusiformis TaxID=28031 RepID=A0A1E4R6B4_9BACI|nr:SDR family oxidoreductase [Lysinibacillus fusiformis]ODV56015.1 3-ketoacyl-ACP reductase [Lysinibacillus fusiformis]